MFTILATSISDFRLTFVYPMDVHVISIESRDGVLSSNTSQDHGIYSLIAKVSLEMYETTSTPTLNYRVIRG